MPRDKSTVSKTLTWQRWLVMALIGAIIAAMEISAHAGGQGHHYLSRSELLRDPELRREILMFGVAVPLLAGTLLTFLERTGIERDKIARALDKRRLFSKALNETTCYEELAHLIVKLPLEISGATRATLAIKRPAASEPELIAVWPDGEITASLERSRFSTCLRCSQESAPHVALPCDNPLMEDALAAETRYCLQLGTSDRMVGILTFAIPEDTSLSAIQADTLNDLAPEVTLSLEKAELQRAETSWREATEAERQRIARNLHDNLGQNVSFLRLKLDQLSGDLILNDITEIRNELSRMRMVADEAYDNVRDALAGLRGTTGDLVSDLRLRAGKMAERSQLTLSVHQDGQPQTLPADTHRQLLYIFGEAMNNVEKHAHAKQVAISIIWREQQLTISLQDDGIGFDPMADVDDEHYGVRIMNERAQAINADLVIASSNGRGGSVTLMLPLMPGLEVRTSERPTEDTRLGKQNHAG